VNLKAFIDEGNLKMLLVSHHRMIEKLIAEGQQELVNRNTKKELSHDKA
jgi:hypothetical protein